MTKALKVCPWPVTALSAAPMGYMVILGAGNGGILQRSSCGNTSLGWAISGSLHREVVPQAGPAHLSETEHPQTIRCILVQKDLPTLYRKPLIVCSHKAKQNLLIRFDYSLKPGSYSGLLSTISPQGVYPSAFWELGVVIKPFSLGLCCIQTIASSPKSLKGSLVLSKHFAKDLKLLRHVLMF